MIESSEHDLRVKTLDRLLEAHLRHELAEWEGGRLEQTVSWYVSMLFRWCETVKLDEVVTREQIMGVIQRYVIELRLSGAITELSGELSRLVLRSRAAADTRVDEILAPASYEEIAEKLIALDGVRRELIALVARSATFASINARMLARSLLDLIVPPAALGRARVAEAALAFAERIVERVAPELKRRTADELASYLAARRASLGAAIEAHLLSVLHPDHLRSLLDEVWDEVAPMRLSEAFALLGEQDLEDFVVLVFEFWQRYRRTPFFRRISEEMVDHFFRKYGQESLSLLIEDMGVDEQMVRAELTSFLAPMVQQAAKSGALEQLLRERLSRFYRSPSALSALGG